MSEPGGNPNCWFSHAQAHLTHLLAGFHIKQQKVTALVSEMRKMSQNTEMASKDRTPN